MDHLTKEERESAERLLNSEAIHVDRYGYDIEKVARAALRSPQPIPLPTHEGWWFEWHPVLKSGIWFPKWCQDGEEGWEWEHHSGDWKPCQPGSWLPVPMPPPLDGKGGG